MIEALKELFKVFQSDKNLVIFCATGIAIVAMFKIAAPENVVMCIVTGMMGIAVGKSVA